MKRETAQGRSIPCQQDARRKAQRFLRRCDLPRGLESAAFASAAAIGGFVSAISGAEGAGAVSGSADGDSLVSAAAADGAGGCSGGGGTATGAASKATIASNPISMKGSGAGAGGGWV